MSRLIGLSCLFLVAATACSSRALSGPAPASFPKPLLCSSCWHPPATLTWQIQFAGKLDPTIDAALFEVDDFDTTSAQVRALHAQGARVACYVDAGSWEKWRPDAAKFPSSALGEPLSGWPGERWLDIRRISLLRPLIRHRLDICRKKSFDAVDFDNVDGYTNKTGFPLKASDQLRYDIFLANLAHSQGLSVALKNDVGQVTKLEPYFDWSVDEQCFQYQECGTLKPFLKAGKPVLEIEYRLSTSQFCPKAQKLGLSSMRKHLSLDAWRQPCSR